MLRFFDFAKFTGVSVTHVYSYNNSVTLPKDTQWPEIVLKHNSTVTKITWSSYFTGRYVRFNRIQWAINTCYSLKARL